MNLIENIKQYIIYLRKRKYIVNVTAHIIPNTPIAYEVYYYNNKRDVFMLNSDRVYPKWLTFYLRYCNNAVDTAKVYEDGKIKSLKREYFKINKGCIYA